MYVLTDVYFQRLEPHHYRFEVRDNVAVLALHRDEDDAYIGVYVPIEYAKGLGAYENLKMDQHDQRLLVQWFDREKKKRDGRGKPRTADDHQSH